MHPKLQAIKEAWDKDVAGGRDEDGARAMARQFVAENPERYVEIATMPVDGEQGLVNAIDVFRSAGFAEKQWEVEAWLLAKVAPQNIGGTLGPQAVSGEDVLVEPRQQQQAAARSRAAAKKPAAGKA